MAFHLLYGEHPGSLIDACLSRICEEAVMWPTRRGYIIVPEKMKAEIERRYIEILKEKKEGAASDSAFMMIDVVSFSRFAYRVLSEVGGASGLNLKPVTRTILIHRILQQSKDEFSVLSHFADRVGFVSEIDEVLGDFYRYGITGSDLLAMDLSKESDATRRKISDFGLLLVKLAEMEEQLGFAPERFSMKRLSEILEKFSKRDPQTEQWPLKRLSFLRDASIWIMGFGENRNFTPEELNIVTLLESVASKLTLTAISDCLSEEAERKDICHFGNRTVESLLDRFPLSSSEKVPVRPDRNAALGCLSEDYANRSCEVRKDLAVPAQIQVFHQINDELEYVAAKIKELVQFHGYRYRDITVVLCDEKEYGNSLHAAFAKYGLDVFLDSKNRLIGTIWMQYISAILEIGSYGWTPSAVIAYLKSGFVSLDPVLVQRFENYILAHGLKNRRRLFRAMEFAKEESEKEMIGSVLPVLTRLKEKMIPLLTASTCREKAVALHDLLADDHKMVEYYVEEWTRGGNQEAALALAASYNTADDTLLALAGEIGAFPISLLNFCDAVISAIASQTLSKIPSFVDQVTITNPQNGYRRPCRAMFIVGAQRKNFPYTSPSEGYLKNREREIISEKLSVDFPNHAKDQAYADFFTAYALLDAPSEELIFTVQNSVEPSSVILFLKESYPKSQGQILDHLTLSDPRVLERERMREYLRNVITRKQDADPEEMNKAIFIWKRFFNGEDLSREEDPDLDLVLPEEMMKERYGDHMGMSVSSIENYVKCPYNFFCDKVLDLEERKIMGLQMNEMGTLGHTIMELALTEYRDAYLQASDDETRRQICEEYQAKDKRAWAEELLTVAQQRDSFLYSEDLAMKIEGDNKLLRSSAETLRFIFDKMGSEEYIPMYFEWRFGSEDQEACKITLKDGRTVTFRGVIDRVDVDPNTNTFRILDYKTGAKKIDYNELFAGENVQLPAYMHVYSKSHPDLEPSGVGYILVKSLKSGKNALGLSFSEETILDAYNTAVKETYGAGNLTMSCDKEDMKKIGEFAFRKIKENCEELYSGKFPSKPSRIGKKAGFDCQNCKFASICNGDAFAPIYRFLPTVPTIQKENGRNMKASEAFVTVLKEGEQA